MIGEWLQGGDSVTEQDAATDSASANILSGLSFHFAATHLSTATWRISRSV